MKKIFLIILISNIFICCSNERHSENIKYDDFKKKVTKFGESPISKIKGLAIDDKKERIRVYNSIIFYELYRQDDCFENYRKSFDSIKNTNFLEFDFQPSIGMSLYSEKYDLFIGGVFFHHNSTIFLDSASLPEKSKLVVREYLKWHKSSKTDSLLTR